MDSTASSPHGGPSVGPGQRDGPPAAAVVDVSTVETAPEGCIRTPIDKLVVTAGLLCTVCIVLFNVMAFSGIHWLESLPYSDYMLYSIGTYKYCSVHVSYSTDDDYICMFLQSIFAALENKEWFVGAQILSVVTLSFLLINVVLQYISLTKNSMFLWCKVLPDRFVLYFTNGAAFVAACVQLVILTGFWRDGLDMEELSLMLHYSDYLSYSILLIITAALLASLTTVLLFKQIKQVLKPKVEEFAKHAPPEYRLELESLRSLPPLP